jgi:hypothetical protein
MIQLFTESPERRGVGEGVAASVDVASKLDEKEKKAGFDSDE